MNKGVLYILDIQKRENESSFEWELRLCLAKINKEIDLDWQEIVDVLGLNIHYDSLRKQTYGYIKYNEYLKNSGIDSKLNEIDIKTLEMKKEKVKLQTEKNEMRRWIRNWSRIELLSEKLDNSMKILQPLSVPTLIKPITNPKVGLTAIADAHVGKEILIKGLQDEIINAYNVDIFEKRMWTFLNKLVHIIEKEKLNEVYVMALGDLIDGILRIGSLTTAEHGVVDSVMITAEILSTWLNELSKYIRVHFYTTLGNHSECRFLNSKSGELAEENLEKIIHWFISNRLKGNPNINIHSCSSVAFTNILGNNVLSIHGQNEKGLEQSIKDYSIMYKQHINLLLSGHLHSFNSKSIGIDTEYVQFPSICGADDFSVKLRKVSNAGSKVVVLEKDADKIIYDIDLQRV